MTSSAAKPKPQVKKTTPRKSANSPTLRRALVTDVPQIQRLVNSYADKGEMLPRSLNDIYENLRDYFVLDLKGELIATVALHINWEDLAEVRSLAVAADFTGKGYGRQLVKACIEDARGLGLKRVFALSYKPDFFAKLGWLLVEKSELPQKVWVECIRCVKFPDCGEVALIYRLEK
jgi:amino-acid N-acetyltransferase